MPDINVTLPDGSTASFPDGTDHGVMERAIQQHLGWKNPQTQAAANTEAAPAATGVVRPSTAQVFDKQANMQQTNREISSFYGRMIPDAAVPYLAAANKYFAEPRDKLVSKAGDMAGTVLRSAVVGGVANDQAQVPGMTPEQYGAAVAQGTKQNPKIAGTAQGLGELVGGTVADPLMWPFAAEGAAKSAMSKLAAQGFTTQLLTSAVSSFPAIRDAVKRNDTFEASRLITSAIAAGALGSLGLMGDAKGKVNEATRGALDKTTGPNPIPAKQDEPTGSPRMQEIENKPLTSTLQKVDPQQANQNQQIKFPTNPPVEAHAPMDQGGASKVANAPLVDRQALLAPNPADFVGKDAPVSLGRFPSSAIENMARGRTLGGVDKFTPNTDVITSPISKQVPKPESTEEPVLVNSGTTARTATSTQSDGMKPIQYSTDNNGTRWAKSGDLDITIPKTVKESDVPEYTRLKLQEQTILRKQGEYGTFKAKQAEGIQSPPPTGPISPELPQTLRNNFDRIAKLSRDADLAESESRLRDLNARKTVIGNATRDMLHEHMRQLDGDQLAQLRDTSAKEAEHLDAQSKAIRDLTDATIRNRGVKGEIADLRAPGGPVRYVVDPETGERSLMKPDAKATRGARSVFDELQGRVPTSDFNQLKINAKPEGLSDEEFAQHVSHLQEERTKIKGRISDAVTVAAETGAPLSTMNIDEHVDALKQIEGLLGKFTEPAEAGRRPNLAAEVDEQGAIKAPEAIKSWTLERQRLAVGTKLKARLGDDEMYQHADMRAEKAQLLRGVSNSAQSLLDMRKTQGGAVGPSLGGTALRGKVKPVSIGEAPTVEDFLDKVRKLGTVVQNQYNDYVATRRGANSIRIAKVTPESDTGMVGFLSVDGKNTTHFVDLVSQTENETLAHSALAELLYPQLKSKLGDQALQAVLSNNNIARKARPGLYEMHNPSSKLLDAVSLDLIKDRFTHRPFEVDTKDAQGRVLSLTIHPGWEDLGEALNQAKTRQGWRDNQRGASGPSLLGSGVAGAAVGGVVGAHIGGPVGGGIGAALGYVVGFTTRAALDSRPVKFDMQFMHGILRNAGMDLKTWFNGAPQIDVGDPVMKQIRAEQQLHSNRGTTWLERIDRLPAEIATGLDPFALVTDKRNQTFPQRSLLSGTKDGRSFRDIMQKDDTKSFYYALRDAKGQALGLRAFQGMQYRDFLSEAGKGGLREALTQGLIYKQYERGISVLKEHMDDLQQKMQEAQKALADPGNTVRETAALQDRLKELQRNHKEIDDKITQGKALPKGYTPESLIAAKQQWEEKLGDDNLSKVNDLMSRVFKSRAHILDMLYKGEPSLGLRGGLISKEALDLYKSRGPEYVPFERIMDDLENGQFHSGVSPLDLKHQTVIQKLEGSERTAVDPWEAFAHADAKAFNQILRNSTMDHAIDLANTYPEIAADFKSVTKDYSLKKGESLLGHYVEGKPQLYAVPSYLGDVMQQHPQAAKAALGAMASWWGHQWKRGATVYNAGFQVASLMKHVSAGVVLNKENASDLGRYVKSWASSVKSVLSQDQDFRELVRSGATFGTLQSVIDPESHASMYDLGSKRDIADKTIFDKAEKFAATLENVNRMATWKNTRLAGGNLLQAAHEAKYHAGAPDFSGLGDMKSALNKAFMFLSAHTKYAAQMGDAVRKNPKRILGVFVATAAADIALQTWNAQQKDSDGNSLLRKVPASEKERNFVVLSPYTHMVNGVEKAYQFNIPKMYMFQLLNPVEDGVFKVTNSDVRTGTQMALDSLGGLSPIPLHLDADRLGSSLATSLVSASHPLAKTVVQQYANTNDFGAPIVPQSQQDIDPDRQVGPHTSGVAKTIGPGGVRGAVAGGALGALTGLAYGGPAGAAVGVTTGVAIGAHGVSPRRLDAGMNSLFAGGSTQTETYLEPFYTGSQATKKGWLANARSTPLLGTAVASFLGGDADAQTMELSRQLDNAIKITAQPLRTLRNLQKTAPDQVDAYLNKNANELGRGLIAERASTRMGEFSKQENAVAQDKTLSDEDRQKQLKDLHNNKLQALKSFLEYLKPVPQPGQTSAKPGQGQSGAR